MDAAEKEATLSLGTYLDEPVSLQWTFLGNMIWESIFQEAISTSCSSAQVPFGALNFQ